MPQKLISEQLPAPEKYKRVVPRENHSFVVLTILAIAIRSRATANERQAGVTLEARGPLPFGFGVEST